MNEAKEVKDMFLTPTGDRYRPVYTPEIAADGQIELVQTGVEDLQQYIDSFKDSCDISVMVQRYIAGDETALRSGNPVFMDLLGAPKTLADAYAINFRAEAAFNNLPADVRARFNNNFHTFLSGAGSKEWFDSLKMDPVPGSIEKEVSDDA